VIVFTVLGLIVFYVWCFQLGWWIGFALDTLLPIWLSMRAFDVQMAAFVEQFFVQPNPKSSPH
jgi:hypothetical protein